MTNRPGKMRILILPVLAVLSAGLASCESTPGEATADSPDSLTASSPSQEASGADPIARYALSAAPGDSAQLQLGDGGQVFVTVGSMYTSAAGLQCRRITLRTQRDASRVSAVCKQSDGWRTVLNP